MKEDDSVRAEIIAREEYGALMAGEDGSTKVQLEGAKMSCYCNSLIAREDCGVLMALAPAGEDGSTKVQG